jgi:hypothetical protein
LDEKGAKVSSLGRYRNYSSVKTSAKHFYAFSSNFTFSVWISLHPVAIGSPTAISRHGTTSVAMAISSLRGCGGCFWGRKESVVEWFYRSIIWIL